MSRPRSGTDLSQGLEATSTLGLTTGSVIAQGKPQSIGTTLWDTLREELLLTFCSTLDLGLRQVSSLQLLSQHIERSSLDQVDRVDDITQGFRHLPAFRVTDQTMAEDLVEGHLVGQDDTQQHHSSNPEEQDVPPGLQEARGIEVLHVLGLRSINKF